MERKIFLTILIGSLLFIVIALLIPGRIADEDPKLPWKIKTDGQGNSMVFGLELGKSPLMDAETIFGDEGEVSLLFAKNGEKTVEAYFDQIFLNGLRGNFVLTIDLEPETVEEMYHRGLRLSTLDSGNKKVSLAPSDLQIARQAPIVHITYLPGTDLSEELLTKIFGIPNLILSEPESGIRHWLYPEKGLDIAVDPERKEVFQYVRPADFEQFIAEPLKNASQSGAVEK